MLLLDDKGFDGAPFVPGPFSLSRDQVELDARTCVGPDEPDDGQTWEQAERWHWMFIAEQLQAAGVETSVDEVSHVEHVVVLDERLLAVVV